MSLVKMDMAGDGPAGHQGHEGSEAWRDWHTVFTNAKAGMASVDKEHVQRVVYEMSKVCTAPPSNASVFGLFGPVDRPCLPWGACCACCGAAHPQHATVARQAGAPYRTHHISKTSSVSRRK